MHYIGPKLTHTEYHQGMAAIIFDSKDQEAIADLLHAWTSRSSSHKQYPSLHVCAKHLIGLHKQSFSSRLRQLVIYAIELIGYQPFEQIGIGGLFGLLNNLQISIKDIDSGYTWAILLLDIIQSPEGIKYLSHQYWTFLVKVAFCRWELGGRSYSPQTTVFLEVAEEWQKLECWLGVVWMMWPPEDGKTSEEELEHAMSLLSHQQPGSIQKLEKLMEGHLKDIPKSFERICSQVNIEASLQDIQ